MARSRPEPVADTIAALEHSHWQGADKALQDILKQHPDAVDQVEAAIARSGITPSLNLFTGWVQALGKAGEHSTARVREVHAKVRALAADASDGATHRGVRPDAYYYGVLMHALHVCGDADAALAAAQEMHHEHNLALGPIHYNILMKIYGERKDEAALRKLLAQREASGLPVVEPQPPQQGGGRGRAAQHPVRQMVLCTMLDAWREVGALGEMRELAHQHQEALDTPCLNVLIGAFAQGDSVKDAYHWAQVALRSGHTDANTFLKLLRAVELMKAHPDLADRVWADPRRPHPPPLELRNARLSCLVALDRGQEAREYFSGPDFADADGASYNTVLGLADLRPEEAWPLVARHPQPCAATLLALLRAFGKQRLWAAQDEAIALLARCGVEVTDVAWRRLFRQAAKAGDADRFQALLARPCPQTVRVVDHLCTAAQSAFLLFERLALTAAEAVDLVEGLRMIALEHVRQRPTGPLPEAEQLGLLWQPLVHLLNDVQRFDEAEVALEEYRRDVLRDSRRELHPGLHAQRLRAHWLAGKPERVRQLVAEMHAARAARPSPLPHPVAKVLAGFYAHYNDEQPLRALLDERPEDDDVLRAALDNLTGNRSLARALCNRIFAAKAAPSVDTYVAAISQLHPDEVEELRKDMARRGVPENDEVVAALARTWAVAGITDRVDALWKELHAHKRLALYGHMALLYAKHLHRADRVRQIADAFTHEATHRAPVQIFKNIIAALALAQQNPAILPTFQRSVELCGADPHCAAVAIHFLGLAKDLDGVRAVMRLIEPGRVLIPAVYRALASAFSQNGEKAALESLLQQLREKNIEPGVQVYVAMIRGHIASGNDDLVEAALQQMRDRGLVVTERVLARMVCAYRKRNDRDAARRVLDRAVADGTLKPDDVRSTGLLFQLCAACKAFGWSSELVGYETQLRAMRPAGLPLREEEDEEDVLTDL